MSSNFFLSISSIYSSLFYYIYQYPRGCKCKQGSTGSASKGTAVSVDFATYNSVLTRLIFVLNLIVFDFDMHCCSFILFLFFFFLFSIIISILDVGNNMEINITHHTRSVYDRYILQIPALIVQNVYFIRSNTANTCKPREKVIE